MPLDRPLPTFPGLRSSRLRRRGITALMCAATRDHDDVVHFLIEAKADLDVANNDGAGPWTGGPRAGTEVLDLWMVFLKSGHKKMYCRGEIHVNPKCLQSNVGHAMGMTLWDVPFTFLSRLNCSPSVSLKEVYRWRWVHFLLFF